MRNFISGRGDPSQKNIKKCCNKTMFGPVKYSHKSVDDISTDIAKEEQNIGIEDQAQPAIRGREIVSKT